MDTQAPTAPEPSDDADARPGREPTAPMLAAVEPDRQPKEGSKLGRYVVLDTLGAGGMGVVYRAFDPQLDRTVALKVLRPQLDRRGDATGGQTRLLREAQAMAQLSHANVIQVFDASVLEDQVVVAMEYVRGESLRAWCVKERPWREVLDVLVEAGRGLVAAHAVGIIHRDFKPANVLVGEDGQVKVLDFGLARPVSEDASGELAGPTRDSRDELSNSYSDSLLDTELTAAGMVMGTPGYMPPEQYYQGSQIGPRLDQFAFCATAYRCLYRQPPFGGETLVEIRERVVKGRIEPPPPSSAVPKWVFRVLERGMSPRQADRYENVATLLDQLRRDPSRQRRKWLVGGAALAAIAAGAVLSWNLATADARVCEAASSQLDGVWDPARRAEAEAAFRATDLPFAEGTWASIEPRLDQYAQQWVASHTAACRATRVSGEQSEALLDRRMACLQERRVELRALVDVLARADAAVVERATVAAQRLSPVSACDDLSRLLGERPDIDAEELERVSEIKQALARARTLEHAGLYEDGMALASEALALAEAIPDERLRAAALMRRGSLERFSGKLKTADQTLRAAMRSGEAGGNDRTKARAATSLVSLLGSDLEQHEEADELAKYARSVVRRLEDDPEALADLHNAVGLLRKHQSRFEEARARWERALELYEELYGPDHYLVATVLMNVGTAHRAAGELDAAQAAQRRALEIREGIYGPNHPETASVVVNLAIIHAMKGELAVAEEHFRRALDIELASRGPEHPGLAGSYTNLGNVLNAQGKIEESREHYARALALAEASMGPDHPSVATAASSLAIALRGLGRLDEAQAQQERALRIELKRLGPRHQAVGISHQGLGEIMLARKQHGAAAQEFELARSIFAENHGEEHAMVASALVGIAEAQLGLENTAHARTAAERANAIHDGIESNPVDDAGAKFVLARALWESPRQAERALDLAGAAKQLYARSEAEKENLEAVERWLAERETRER